MQDSTPPLVRLPGTRFLPGCPEGMGLRGELVDAHELGMEINSAEGPRKVRGEQGHLRRPSPVPPSSSAGYKEWGKKYAHAKGVVIYSTPAHLNTPITLRITQMNAVTCEAAIRPDKEMPPYPNKMTLQLRPCILHYTGADRMTGDLLV